MNHRHFDLKYRCPKTTDELEPLDARSYHCVKCEHAVHDISQMTELEAEHFLRTRREAGERTCVVFEKRDGRVQYADDPKPSHSSDARRQLAAQHEGSRALVGVALATVAFANLSAAGLALYDLGSMDAVEARAIIEEPELAVDTVVLEIEETLTYIRTLMDGMPSLWPEDKFEDANDGVMMGLMF